MKKLKNKAIIISVFFFCAILLGIVFLFNSYALTEPIATISFDSERLDYSAKEPGSIHVDKSAQWMDTNQARITFAVDTVRKTSVPYTDVILVLDTSSSMNGNAFNRMKEEVIHLLDDVLVESNNHVALINFSATSQILSEFTTDKNRLSQLVNSLTIENDTNYYQALVNVDNVLENYEKKDDTECIVLFLTDGSPSRDVPNEVAQYDYLKDKYPYLTINAVQYEMGDVIFDSVKRVSDYQYIAGRETLYEILVEASAISVPYDKFILTDTIDSGYFEVTSIDHIHPSIGTIELIEEDGIQKVRWTIEKLLSGKKPTLTIDVHLKDELKSKDGIYPTNQEESLVYQMEDIEEMVTSKKTPKLQSFYEVKYEGNFPTGCTANNVPEATRQLVKDSIAISNLKPSCQGYQFTEWKIVTKDTYQLSDSFFEMPEHDVLLRAEWSKLTVAKSMDGDVYVVLPQVLQSIDFNYKKELWQYKDSITRIVFSDTMIEPANTQETWDISDAKDGSVIGRIALNDGSTDTYTAYIQGDGKVIANSNSRYLFSGFTKLETIEGLEYFDTSHSANMRSMFADCKALTTLDLSSFDTSNVVNMNTMFNNCNALTSLNLSSFHTEKVNDMSFMFENCRSLIDLDLSSFSTEKVTDMRNMFSGCNVLLSITINTSNFKTGNVTDMSYLFHNCSSLTAVDVSDFDTSSATSMRSMFEGCNALTSLNLSHFDTSKVTEMGYMFSRCSALSDLDISNFNTSNVTNMWYMFSDCAALTVLDLKHFDTSNVANMRNMFFNCTNLSTLDVSGFKTENVEDMSFMFYDCNQLTNLDIIGFHTPKVTTMRGMFQKCSGLTTLDVSKFDTSNVTDMSLMFSDCSALTILDLSSFTVPKVLDLSYMFNKCTALTEVKFDSFNSSQAQNMAFMFAHCSALQILDLNSFVTEEVTDMSFMFYDCNTLATLNIGSFHTPKVTTMKSMFQGCNVVTSLDVTNFDTSNVTDMANMFYHCDVLANLDVSGFDFGKVTDVTLMFYRNAPLSTTINMNGTNITAYSSMFSRAANDGTAQIIVNYTAENSDLVDLLIATKSSASNIVKGTLIS